MSGSEPADKIGEHAFVCLRTGHRFEQVGQGRLEEIVA
jgi:hypothetical protein